MRTVRSLEELDDILMECDQAEQKSDDALRHVFQTFRMDPSPHLPADPFSADYFNAQLALYKQLAGRVYTTANEETVFDIDAVIDRPFPYSASPQVAGAHFGAIGLLLRSMHLPPGARVLDVGPGWGNTTMTLAQMGYQVTALDIEPRFCELIRQRCAQVGVDVDVVNADFFWIEGIRDRFDGIVFFESFHHCADHPRLLRALGPALTPDGHVYFGAEPISSDFPVPWGVRMDGESLWAIRRHGWLELGFQPGYFRRALRLAGLYAQSHMSVDLPWINVWDAKVGVPEAIGIPAWDPRLATQTGARENGSIQLRGAPAGYALHGPYMPLMDGRYKAAVYFGHQPAPRGHGVIDVCADSGRRVIFQAPFDATTLWREELALKIEFELSRAEKDVEVRLHCAADFWGSIERLELTESTEAI